MSNNYSNDTRQSGGGFEYDDQQQEAFSNHNLNAFAPWFRRQFEFVCNHLAGSPYPTGQNEQNQQDQHNFKRGYSFESDNRSEMMDENMASDEPLPPPPSIFRPFALLAPRQRSVASQRNTNNQQRHPSKTLASYGGGLMTCYKDNPKRRMNLWTVLALLTFGPPIFLVGYFAGHGIDAVTVAADKVNEATSSSGSDDSYSNVFLKENEIIQSEEKVYLNPSGQGAHLKQESNGNLIFLDELYNILWSSGINAQSAIWKSSSEATSYYTKLQGDGALVTRSRTINNNGGVSSHVIWSSQSNSDTSEDDEYTLQLNPAKNGLQIVRGGDGVIIWQTINYPTRLPRPDPTRLPTSDPTAPYPTRQPTSRPTSFPTRNPTPRPTREPTPQPTMFPRPPTVDWSTSETLESGPMMGHTTHSSVKIWALQGYNKTMQLVVWPLSSDPSTATSVSMPPNQVNGASIMIVEDLAPKTLYLYELRLQNQRIAEGHFTTAPPPNASSKFSYLLASCMDIKNRVYREQPVWDVIRSKNPDFAMLNGDTIYLNDNDWTDEGEILFDRVWLRNMRQRAESHFASFLKSIPTYGTWDDHEYGKSNSNHDQLGKENSLKAWKALWPNPRHGLPELPGVFYTYTWGDVHFIVMDNRWYRNNPRRSQFGPAQKEWLYQQLINSKSTFKIIVSGSDVMEDSWSGDLKDIGVVINQYKISGVLFNAGDIHRNQFKQQTIENWPYDVLQITSSGIAREWRRNFAIIDVDTSLPDPEIMAQFYGAANSNFETTWIHDPDQTCSDIVEIDRNKASSCIERIRLSDLTV